MEYLIYVIPLSLLGITLLIASELGWRSKLPLRVALSTEELEVFRNKAMMQGKHICAKCYEHYTPDERDLAYCNICAPNFFPSEQVFERREPYMGKGFMPAYMKFPDLYKGDDNESK